MKKVSTLLSLFIIFTSSTIAQSNLPTQKEVEADEMYIEVEPAIEYEKLTVQKIWKDFEFSAKGVQGFRSMNDGNYFTKITTVDKKQSVTRHKFADYTGQGVPLITPEMINGIVMDDYSFNSDETKALITTETQSIYRRSYSAVYYLLDLKTKKLEQLDAERQPQTLAEYSPDGKKVSYIYKNNLYVKDLESGKVKQLTKDGERNKVINGTTDWVYEEEFAITKAYGWSPDSKYIAYLKFDESEVKEFTMAYYYKLYPYQYTFKYPKAGEDNSKVLLYMVKAKGGKSKQVDLGNYEYIPRMKWSNTDNNLIVQTLNRHQNHLKYHLVSFNKKKVQSKVFFEEKSKSYVEIDDNLLILSDGKTIVRTSEANGYNHIYTLTFDGKSTQITKGNWDIIECYGVDEEASKVFYSCAREKAYYKGIEYCSLDPNNTNTGKLTASSGYHNASFSNGMKYCVISSSEANNPSTHGLYDNKGSLLSILEDNNELLLTLSKYNYKFKEFVEFKGHEKSLNGWMIKPPNFDPNKKYPVYINIYGGPGHNTVTDSWGGNNYMYHQLLAQNGYIVVSVDPRGTMYRGADFKKSTYLQLGKLETEDFIAVAKELQSYSYVDAERIGIMGWSYGGFMTSLAMTKGADVFKMGIAVAPVTNWRYYDNIYTERFMRTPEENPDGYDNNSPINFTDKLKGKYLLIHGSGDDNVHYQNTMEMINAMVKSNKQFDLFIYPNKNHGIYGGNTRNHLFQMMLDYTLENL
jgi:dipeptidyl-peptidase-4